MIGVLGANGRLGGLVAGELARRSASACALVRQPSRALALPARYADLAEPASLDAALGGVERLFLVTPHGPQQDLLEQAAIGAACRAGVQRIVKISGGAATLGPNGVTATAVAHWRGERLIEDAGVEFAFLRPSFFMQNLVERFATPVRALGLLASPLGAAPIAMVDARDVAACAVEALLAPTAGNRAWQLTGPAAVSLPSVATRLGVRHLAIPQAVATRALLRRGASDFELDHARRMATHFASGADGTVTDHVRRLTGRAGQPIDAFLHEHAGAFAPTTSLARVLTRRTGG
jgi:uncharacterized protein YbjT (DUF2867 family)